MRETGVFASAVVCWFEPLLRDGVGRDGVGRDGVGQPRTIPGALTWEVNRLFPLPSLCWHRGDCNIVQWYYLYRRDDGVNTVASANTGAV